MICTSSELDKALVSVGIPTYNRPEGLRRTLDCILAQTYRNLEILVSDNASGDDDVMLVCQEYVARDSRVRIFRQASNVGIVRNFRFVLEAANGRYFMWAADDDEWEPGFIETCIRQLEQGAVTAVTASMLHLRYHGHRFHQPVPRLSLSMSRYEAVAAFLMRPYPSMIYGLHRREALLDCTSDPSWFDFYDCYAVLRLLLLGPGVVCPEVLFVAGVDAPQYEIKPMGKSLRFEPFFRAVIAALDAADLNPGERKRLKALALLTTFRMALSYWKSRLGVAVSRWASAAR